MLRLGLPKSRVAWRERAIMWSLPTAKRAIIIAGCMSMVYTQLTMSPATIEFARSLDASAFHIGLLGALPTAMVFMQFVAAVVANHLRYRRPLWLAVSIVQRLILVPAALGPLLFPDVVHATWLLLLVATTAVNHALLHFGSPLWLSWMGDYLPHAGLNSYWGVRQRWMQWAGALSLLAGAFFVHKSGVDTHTAFAVLIGVGAIFGVGDLLFFLKIEEPTVQPVPEPSLIRVFSAPFKESGFRTFISYACFWNFAAMIGAPFISLYLLSEVGLSLFHLLLLWTFCWAGGALVAVPLGRAAEKYGNRPVLVLCTSLKSTNMIALLFLPSNLEFAFCLLALVFLVDSGLNAGIAIASNGFMLKKSPSVNRTMYIAAGTALAGMVGGVASILAGAALVATASWQVQLGTATVGNFELLFATSLALRLISVVYALRIQEPEAHGTPHVMTQLIGATPLRVLRFPVGLYRGFRFRRTQRSTEHELSGDDLVTLAAEAVDMEDEERMRTSEE